MFIQAGFAVDSPAAHYLVRSTGYKKADLALQFVWWCVYKLAVIPGSLGSIGLSHLLHSLGVAAINHCRTLQIMPRVASARKMIATLDLLLPGSFTGVLSHSVE